MEFIIRIRLDLVKHLIMKISESNRQALKERPRSGNHRRPYQQLFRFKEVLRKTGMSDL